tara:strand:- start:855 stop:2171 length:1317 start_codon:yes stop_codon:yes gene_type:complete
MSTERFDWTYEWAGLIRSHTESTTLLQYTVDALQLRLPEEYMCTLWVLSTNSADWVPIVFGRNNLRRQYPWRSPTAATRQYIEQLSTVHHMQVCSSAAGNSHAVFADREVIPVPWIHHWLCGGGEDYMGVLEIGGEAPGSNELETICQMVETLLPTICRITQSPLFSVETFSTAPLPQTKTYEALTEEERLMSLGRLVASVTHEINSPLGVAITGVSHLNESLNELNKHFSSGKLTESFFRHFVDESKDVADLLAFNLERAVRLIGDFKANAVNQGADQAVRFELEPVLNSTTNSILPELRRHGIELKVGKVPHCVLWSFPGAISQIITNLVFNSINHAFTGIDNKQIALHSEIDPHSGALKLIYRDNGIGIPQKDQQAVFEPYFTTRREAGGSGLGLSIVKALATNKLKGDLTFKSAPRKGVEFAFTLPLDIRQKKM